MGPNGSINCSNLSMGYLKSLREAELNGADRDLLEAAQKDGDPGILHCEELRSLPKDWDRFDDDFERDRWLVVAKYLKRREATHRINRKYFSAAFYEEIKELVGEKYCRFLSLLPPNEYDLNTHESQTAFLQGAMTCSKFYLSDQEIDNNIVKQFINELEKASHPEFLRQAYLLLVNAAVAQFSAEVVDALTKHFSTVSKTFDETQILNVVRALGGILEKYPEGKIVALLVGLIRNPSQFSDEVRAAAAYELSKGSQDKLAIEGISLILSRQLAQEQNPIVHRELAATLAALKVKKSGGTRVPSEMEILASQLNYIREPDPNKRMSAAEKLTYVEGEKAKTFAGMTLLQHSQTLWEPNDDVREAVVRALGDLGAAALMSPVADELLGKMDDEGEAGNVRTAAAFSLGKLGESISSPTDLKDHEERYKLAPPRSNFDSLRGKAVWALGFIADKLGDAKIVQSLIDLAEGKRLAAPFIQMEALLALSRLDKFINDSEMFSLLQKQLDKKSEPSDYVRAQIVLMFKGAGRRFAPAQVTASLSKCLDPWLDPSEWVRQEAIEVVRYLGKDFVTPEISQKLWKIYEDEEGIFSEEVSNAAYEALEELREEEDL